MSASSMCLRNGVRMPSVGFGTYQIKDPDQLRSSLLCALAGGYRHIDTAAVYKNEAMIGAALKEAAAANIITSREDVFLTSKLSPADHGRERAESAIRRTLSNLQTDYLDLYLVHWPGVQGKDVSDAENPSLRRQSWAVIEDHYKRGVFRAIGVSNYEVRHLKELLGECSEAPHVNQIEVQPQFQNEELVAFCRANDIHVTAYSSLGKGADQLLEHPTVLEVSKLLDKTPAQVHQDQRTLKNIININV